MALFSLKDLIDTVKEKRAMRTKVVNPEDQPIPVQLTGSIVGEQKIATDLIVTVGSKTTIATLDTSNYKEVGLRVERKDTSGDSRQNIAFYMQLGFPGILYMDGFDVNIPLINERASMLNYRAITMMVEVDAPKIVFKLENKGNSDHIYDVWLVYKTR